MEKFSKNLVSITAKLNSKDKFNVDFKYEYNFKIYEDINNIKISKLIIEQIVTIIEVYNLNCKLEVGENIYKFIKIAKESNKKLIKENYFKDFSKNYYDFRQNLYINRNIKIICDLIVLNKNLDENGLCFYKNQLIY